MAKPDRSFCHVAIAISDYGSGWQSLPQIREPAEHLARLFGADLQQFERGGLVSEVAGAVRRLIDGVSLRGTLLLHWVGHGSASGEQHYLICKDSPAADRLDETQAFATELLGRLIAQSKAEQVCIILDTCYSGDGAIRLANRLRANLALQLPREGWNRVFSIIASAHPLESVDAGRFSQGLVAALERPDVYGKWSRADEYITTEQLARGARHILEVGDTPMRPVGFKDGIDDVMIPNPLFRPACGESDLDTRRFLEGVFGDNGHFALSAKGVEAQEAGYFFSGRRSILAALHDRLGDGSDEDGLTIVTGPPGSGKSAVIGRLVSLSVPALRAAIERAGGSDANTPLRPIGVDIAIHAKGKTLPECVRIAAHVLGPDRATVEESETVALLGSVRALGRPLLFVFDALDEAAEGQAERIANELIRPLAAIPGVKVLVGTRRSLRGDVLAADEDRHGRLRAAFGTEARIFDLADEPETAADIAEFVVRRLNSATHLGTERWRTRAGHAVAAVAEGSFLYARLVARSLEALPDEPLDDLPADANAAFASDLARRFAGEEVRVTETLRALAFGLGRGLSRSVWVVVANALARERRYTDDDVAWIVTRVGSYIVETSVKIGGRHQAVYRLIHKAVADALAKDVEDAWIAIADALIEDIGGDDWLMVDPYLRRHAAQHAFLADQRQADAFAQFDIVSGTSTGLRFDALITQPGFLAVAEPEHLLPLIPYARSSDAITARGLYWLASHDLRAMTPLERWSRLHLQALVQDWEDRDGFAPPALAPWRTSWRWSTSRPPTPNMRLAGHTKAVLAITTGRLGNKEIVASGSEDGTVRLWDLNSGMPIGAPLVGNGSPIRAVVIGEVDGKTIVASGSKDGAIRLWDAKTGGLVGEPLAGHDPHPVNAIAFGKIRERPVFASAGDDAAIRLWDAATGASIGEPLRAHRLWIWTVEMGQMDGRSVIASGGADREVRIWDAATGDQLVEPIAFRGERVPSLALGEFDGAPLLAVVDVSDVFELIELQSGKSITYLTMPDADKICLRSVRATTHLAMASARKFTVVTVSRGGTGKLETHFLDEVVAEEGMLNCIALGDTHDRAVPVSGGRDAMVRLWDISTTRRSAEPPEQQSRLFTAIAAATVEGTDVIVAGGADGIVRFWDAFSGDLVGDPFSGGSLPEDESDPELPRCTWIDRVALHRLGERDLLVAQDGWLRVWATAPGLPRDAPLLTIGSSPSCFVLGESRGRPVLVIGTTGKRTGMMYRDPGIVEVRDLDTGHLSCEPINGHDDAITAVAISEIDGRTVIASAALDRTIRLWDAVTGRPLSPAIIVPEKTVTQLAFGRTGDRPLLISGDDGGGVRWWEPATGEPIETAGRELLGRHEDAVSAIVFATLKDRPVVVSGGKDCVVGVWDASSGARLCAIPTGKPVTAVEIDKHGNVVARLANSDLVAFEIRL